MLSISTKSKQFIVAAGLALGVFALGACGGGGGSSPIAQPNQLAPVNGDATVPLSSAGQSITLPGVAGFTEALTVPANNAAAGTNLSFHISPSAPAGMPPLDPDMHVAIPFLYFTISTNKDVRLNGFPGFKLTVPTSFDMGTLPAKIGFYNPTGGWVHVGDFVASGRTITFAPTSAALTLKAGVTYYALPYTCGGPSPSPTPTGVISCAASGSGPIGVLCVGSKTYAFVGKGPTGSNTVEQLDISKGALGSSSSTLFHTYNTDFGPSSCNGDSKHLRVFCSGFSASKVADINGTSNTFTEFDTHITGFLTFTGGSCTICMVTYDPKDNAFILLGADPGGGGRNSGKFVNYGENSHTLIRSIHADDPNENPGYDYVSNKVFSPVYEGDNHLQLADFNDGHLYDSGSAVSGISVPDSASVDVATHIGATPNEFDFVATIADLGTAAFNTTTHTFTVNTGQKTLLSTGHTCGLDDDGSATDSVLHLTFFTGEFCTPGSIGFMLLPTTSSGTTISDWAFIRWPNTPSGPFASSGDPHPIAAFNDPTNCPDCGLVINSSFTWLAVIDLNKLMHAPRSTTDPHAIAPSYNLLTNHVIGFYPI